MQPLKCSISFLLLLGICHMCLALPRMRVKRQDNLVTLEDEEKDNSLNPINAAEEVSDEGLERNKRKLPEHKAEAKNAILGFVFGKIDNFLDTKINVIEQLDKANIEKNKEYDIKSPVPIKDFQTLVTAVVSPKIRTLGNLANDLTTGILTTITALSGSSSGGGDGNAALGNVVTRVLGFSGPILQGASGGAGGSSSTPAPDSDEAGY